MSCDYYFRMWRQTLTHLEKIVHIDQEFQEWKPHEQSQCKAAQRLSGVLAEYLAIFNDLMECSLQNLQVQKTEYIAYVIHAVVSRILELKHQLKKLESSNYQFLNDGLIDHKLTTNDIELSEVPTKVERSERIHIIMKDIIAKVNKIKEETNNKDDDDAEEAKSKPIDNWWDEKKSASEPEIRSEITEEPLSEAEIKKIQYINIIKAHERTRLVTLNNVKRKHKKEIWAKELAGKLLPLARLDIRNRSAKIIQTLFRAYFELKRNKVESYKRDILLGIKIFNQVSNKASQKLDEIKYFRLGLKCSHEKEWKIKYEEMKLEYLKGKGNDISEHYRDYIRDWFLKWYKEALFFYDIPDPNIGGAALILKEEVLTPTEWLEKYQQYLEQKVKKKSPQEVKWEKMEAKKEKMLIKKQELLKKKAEQALLKKLMKNPDKHPGFLYPVSHKIGNIINAIKTYHEIWDDLDIDEEKNVKKKYVKDIDYKNICFETKIDLLNSVDEDMRKELKVLKKSLKIEYNRNGETMPTSLENKKKRRKKKCKLYDTISKNVAEKIEDLILRGFLKEYPKTNFQDFLGDPNFAGDDIRCSAGMAMPSGGEMRQVWWEKCREVIHGFRKMLLVGPSGSGKTKLVHILASVNDAFLFELNTALLPMEFLSVAYLQQIVTAVASSAKALQPSVIYIKHVHLFYENKVTDEDDIDYTLIEQYFVKKLFQRIHKADKITIVGTCINPWLAKSKMLKAFPDVLLLPFTSYNLVSQLLHNWINKYQNILYDVNVTVLAHMLQGYSYNFIKESLNEFMSSDRIAKVATYGLQIEEVYDFFLEKDESKVEIEKYLQWYQEKTKAGKREHKAIMEQKEFIEIAQRWAEKKNSRKAAKKA